MIYFSDTWVLLVRSLVTKTTSRRLPDYKPISALGSRHQLFFLTILFQSIRLRKDTQTWTSLQTLIRTYCSSMWTFHVYPHIRLTRLYVWYFLANFNNPIVQRLPKTNKTRDTSPMIPLNPIATTFGTNQNLCQHKYIKTRGTLILGSRSHACPLDSTTPSLRSLWRPAGRPARWFSGNRRRIACVLWQESSTNML